MADSYEIPIVCGFDQKNKEDAIIVISDGSETIGSETAKKFVEKGFDNVYLLSGGTYTDTHAEQSMPAGAAQNQPKARALHTPLERVTCLQPC